MVNTDIPYQAVIYSTENLEVVDNTLNEHFLAATETEYFSEDIIHGQRANLTQIQSNEPKFTKGEIAVISASSGLMFVIIIAIIAILILDKCTGKTVLLSSAAFIMTAVTGPLTYFAIAGTVDWVISASVIGGLLVTFVLIAIFVGFCHR